MKLIGYGIHWRIKIDRKPQLLEVSEKNGKDFRVGVRAIQLLFKVMLMAHFQQFQVTESEDL